MAFLYTTFIPLNVNKTRTFTVGAISKAQKARNIFLEKKLEIFEFFSVEKPSDGFAEARHLLSQLKVITIFLFFLLKEIIRYLV